MSCLTWGGLRKFMEREAVPDNAEIHIGQKFFNLALHLNRFFFRHRDFGSEMLTIKQHLSYYVNEKGLR